VGLGGLVVGRRRGGWAVCWVGCSGIEREREAVRRDIRDWPSHNQMTRDEKRIELKAAVRHIRDWPSHIQTTKDKRELKAAVRDIRDWPSHNQMTKLR